MIDYAKTERGDILRLVGAGAPGQAEIGDLVRVLEHTTNGVKVETKTGSTIEFVFNCGAARLEETEWEKDFSVKSEVKNLHIGWYNPASKRFCYTDEKITRPDTHGGYNIPVYTYSIIEMEELFTENKKLRQLVSRETK